MGLTELPNTLGEGMDSKGRYGLGSSRLDGYILPLGRLRKQKMRHGPDSSEFFRPKIIGIGQLASINRTLTNLCSSQ